MTIANEITRINNAKAAIKQSIENKGVTVSDDAKIDEYPALINSITVGESGDSETHENPDFYELRTGGGTRYRSLFYQYAYPSGSFSLDLSSWDTSRVTDMSYMFYYCNALTSLDVSNWDTSRVTDMGNMFYYCQELTELNLAHFNFSNAKSTNSMFANCKKLIRLDLSGVGSSSILYSVSGMFDSCSSLISVNITGWDTSKVTTINGMFTKCTALTTIIGEIDTSSLTNGLYPGSSSHPFNNCTSLETVYIKNIYKDIAVTNASKFSIDLGVTKVKDECLVYIINELPDLINDKGLTATDKIIFTLPKTNTLTEEQVQVALDKGWTCANIATASATYGLRRRMFYKAVECEEGAYQASDGSRYEIFEANNVVTPDGVAEWDEFSSIEDASEYYGLTYIGEQEDGQ